MNITVLLIVAAQLSGANEPRAEDNEQALAPVIVTAQRREQDAADVPLSLTVIEARDLDNYGAGLDDIRALGARAPSVNAESSFGRTFPRFYIRGLGNGDFDLNASQPVSLVYDDVVLENPTLKGYPIFDIDRVEVLRGPQGTLFGRNTVAGVIKFDSVRPGAGAGHYARLGAGRFGALQTEGAIDADSSDAGAFRLSWLAQHRDDFARNTAIEGDRREGFDERAARAQWLTGIGENGELLLQARARDLSGGSTVYQANLIGRGSNRIVADYDRQLLSQDARPTLDVESAGLSARLSVDFGGLRLASITAVESVEMFARGDVDGGFGASFAPPFGRGEIPFPAESGDGIPDHRQFTQELRLESLGEGAWQWQAGALYYDERLDIDNISYDTLAGSVENGRARQRQDHRATALFGAVDVSLSERFALGAGLRYSDDDKDFVAERLTSPFGAGALGPIAVRTGDNDLSGNLALSFQQSDALLWYARAASGFRAPAIQGRVLFGDTVSVADTETIAAFEVGMKWVSTGGHSRLSLNAFDYVVDDVQLTAVGGGQNFNTLINAEHARGRGIEFDVQSRLGAIEVGAGASFNDTEIDDDDLTVQVCGSPCTVLDPPGGAAGTARIDGNPLPQAPRWVAHVSWRYAQPIGSGQWFIENDWRYRSEVNFFLYESREFRGAALLEGGLRLGYQRDGLELALIGRNLLDRVEVVGGVDFNNLTGFVNEPRYVGIELTRRWD